MVSVPSSQGRKKFQMATSSAASYLKSDWESMCLLPQKWNIFCGFGTFFFFHSPHPLHQWSLFSHSSFTKDIQASCTKESAILVLFLWARVWPTWSAFFRKIDNNTQRVNSEINNFVVQEWTQFSFDIMTIIVDMFVSWQHFFSWWLDPSLRNVFIDSSFRPWN